MSYFVVFFNNCICHIIKRYNYKENITYNNYLKTQSIFINFLKSTYSESDVIGSADNYNNKTHSGTQDGGHYNRQG